MDKEKIKKTYEVEGVIPTLTAALSIVKNKLLGPALSKKYPDYVTYLTYSIVEVKPLTPESEEKMAKGEVNFMDRPALIRHIKDLALPVLAPYYPKLLDLREAVTAAKDDPAGYTKRFELRRADLELDLQMAAANPELFGESTPASELIGKVSLTPKPKASTPKDLHIKTENRLAGLKAEQIRDGEMAPMDTDPEDL
jgi:hypothetical protein